MEADQGRGPWAWMREQVRLTAMRVGRMRQASGVSLVALLCASAVAPVVAAGMPVGPVLLAGVGVVGSVGANVLTDVVNTVIERLRADGQPVTVEVLEPVLAAELEAALTGSAESSAALREFVAAVLRELGAVQMVVQAAVDGDDRLRVVLAEGLAGLDGQFSEFALVVDDVRRAVWTIEEALREERATRRVQAERAREQSLMLSRVLSAVTGRNSGGSGRAGGEPVWDGCPYLGLVPFVERDARVFYGRKRLTARLVQAMAERLTGDGPLVVIGASGAGKSSLLRAGLLPALAADALAPGSGGWPRRVLTPGAHPLRELAALLADVAGEDPLSVYRRLSLDPGKAAELVSAGVREAVVPGAGGPAQVPPRLVLIVDQFEELFTLGAHDGAGREGRDGFVEALQALAMSATGPDQRPAALVVIAVRADFLDQLAAYPGLADAVGAGPFLVGVMTEAELRLAITGPAAEAGLEVDAQLLDAVVAEAHGSGGSIDPGSGALPLVSQAMAAAWEQREGHRLTLRAYQRGGGLADAVDRNAQAAYERLAEGQRHVARAIFTHLTLVTPEGRIARRRSTRPDVYRAAGDPERAEAVIAAFAARRLLLLEHDHVEICHDVLLHAWARLRDWLGGDVVDRALYGQLIADADAWKTHQRERSYLYHPGRLPAIDDATARWARDQERYPELPASAHEFVAANQRAARGGARRRRAVIAGLLALTLAATAAAGFALANAAAARAQHDVALSRELAAESLVLEQSDPLTASQLAVAAWKIAPTGQAASAMTLLLTEQQQGMLVGHRGAVHSLAFSPDGRMLASGGSDGTIRLWNPAIRAPLGAPLIADTDSTGWVDSLAFSPDSKTLVSVTEDPHRELLQLWDTATHKLIGDPLLSMDGQSAVSAAFSPDAKILAIAESSEVRLFDAHTHRLLWATPGSMGCGALSIAFAPNGTLVTGDNYGTICLWDPVTRHVLAKFTAADTIQATALAISADGRFLAVGRSNVSGQPLWDLASRQLVRHRFPSSIVQSDSPNSVALNSDGSILAVASGSAAQGGSVDLWDPATGRKIGSIQAGADAPLNAVAFNPNGTVLASAGANGVVQLWSPITLRPIASPWTALSWELPPMSSPVAFTAHGDILAFMNGNQLELRDPVTRQLITSYKGTANSRSFSSHSTMLAIGDATGIQLWDYLNRKLIGKIPIDYPGTPFPAIAVNANGTVIAIGLDNFTRHKASIELWNTETLKLISTFPIDRSDGRIDIQFSLDGKSLLARVQWSGTEETSGSAVYLWNVATRKLVEPPLTIGGQDRGYLDAALSADGETLAVVSGYMGAEAAGSVQFWDVTAHRPLGPPLDNIGGTDLNTAILGEPLVVFDPLGDDAALVDSDGTVRVWDSNAGRSSDMHLVRSSIATSIAFSPNGRLLAVGYTDGKVQLWNINTGAAISAPLTVAADNVPVGHLAFSTDGMLLATGSSDETVQTWSVQAFLDPYAALCASSGPADSYTWNQYEPNEPQPAACT